MDNNFLMTMVDKFNSSQITELDLNDGKVRLILKKENTVKQKTQIPIETNDETQPSVHLGISSGTDKKIKSPIVGTFYSSPSPDAPPFVKPGTKVKIGQTLCILEAMKMMNHLEAEFDCEIIEVHASNGDLVEYGQELFTVKP